MSASATFTRPVGHLSASLDSNVVLPGDERFDEARRAWNLAIDQRPAAVIFPEFRLFPHTQAYAGALWYPIQRASEVLHAWGELTRGPVPDELTTIGRLLNFPPNPQIPEPVRGKSFVIVEAYHTGDPAQADALLAPLRALGPVNDTITTVPVPALSHLHMDPEQPVPGAADGMMIGSLPAEAVDAFVNAAGPGAAFPLLTAEIRHLGAELARPRPGNGALASLDAHYVLFAASMTPVPELVAPVTAQVEKVKSALAPWAARQMYLNFAETQHPAAPFWTEQAYQRPPQADRQQTGDSPLAWPGLGAPLRPLAGVVLAARGPVSWA